MSRLLNVLASLAILLALTAPLAAGQVTATSFTYQGRVQENGTGIDAAQARLSFRLWDAATGGSQVGSDVVAYPVVVVDGIFTTALDFGESAFGSALRYLEVGIDPAGGTSYTWFAPRQPLTPAPVALFALHSGDSVWELSGSNISYTDGMVGVGTASPAYPLDVASDSALRVISGLSTDTDTGRVGVYGECRNADGSGVLGKAVVSSGTSAGVRGETTSPDGIGVRGYAGYPSGGTPIGVLGSVRYSGGIGLKGMNTASLGNGIAILGEATSSTGFGGYFLGRGYFSGPLGLGVTDPTEELEVGGTAKMSGFQLTTSPQAGYVLTSDANGNGTWQAAASGGIGGSGTPYYLARFTGTNTLGSSVIYETTGGNVGIGTTVPSQKLQVLGTVRMNGFQLPSSPQAGYVLTSDASGTGTWQAATGGSFSLPYSGSITSTGAAFSVTNSGTSIGSHAIQGRIDGASSHSDAAAGSFNANGSNGHGVTAFSNAASTIYSQYTGTNSQAFYGSSSGTGAAFLSCSSVGGYGVRGRATSSTSSSSARGGWFDCLAPLGQGVYATASGSEATGVYTEASGENGTGLIAKGERASALLYGNVTIYEYGTNNKVIELGKGLDYAEGFDVAAAHEVTPGTVLVIDPAHPGKLACSRAAYDQRVAGIVAGANGLGSGVRLGSGEFDHDVALAGRVYCNVIALDEDIQPGDMLTTSDVAGHAMKATDRSRAQGAVLGKAMEPLTKGERGRILVLVTLQ